LVSYEHKLLKVSPIIIFILIFGRFSPQHTDGEGPNWLQNLYFIYMLEMRAIAKATPYLIRESYFTGKAEEDRMVLEAVRDILKVIQ